MIENRTLRKTESTVEEELSLKQLILTITQWWHYLISKWWLILIVSAIGALLGFLYAYNKKPVYTAQTTFVLEEGDGGGGLGGMAGLASVVGIDLGGGGGGIFQGDNILELYRSRTMIQETLLTPDTLNGKRQLLIDRYIHLKGLREKWAKNPELANIHFNTSPEKFSRAQDSIIGSAVKDINSNFLDVIRPDKKLSIISVQVKSTDEAFSKAFSDNIVNKVNQFYTETKTKKSADNLNILQNQADSVRRVMNYSVGGAASAIDANPNANPAFQRLLVPSQRKQIDVQASVAVYQEIMKNLELAKITVRREKPLIQVIDRPIFPLEKIKTGKLISLILGGLIGGILIVVILIVRRVIKINLQPATAVTI